MYGMRREVYRIFVRKSCRKESTWKICDRRKDIIKISIQKVGC